MKNIRIETDLNQDAPTPWIQQVVESDIYIYQEPDTILFDTLNYMVNNVTTKVDPFTLNGTQLNPGTYQYWNPPQPINKSDWNELTDSILGDQVLKFKLTKEVYGSNDQVTFYKIEVDESNHDKFSGYYYTIILDANEPAVYLNLNDMRE